VLAGLASDPAAQRFVLNIAVAFMPLAVLGLLFGKAIKATLFNARWRGDGLHRRRLHHPLGRKAPASHPGRHRSTSFPRCDAFKLGLARPAP
jgi:hypothetical protein